MTIENAQHIRQLVAKAPILVCLPAAAGIDEVCAALALQTVLQSESNATVDIMADDWQAPQTLAFIKKTGDIRPTLPSLQRLNIKVDLGNTSLENFSHTIEDGRLLINIDPAQGSLAPKDVTVKNTDFRYAAIFTLGVASLSSLGRPFIEAPDFFYKTPIINIDYRPSNERYGTINQIDPTATSVSEIMVFLLREVWSDYNSNPRQATYLLTGIMARTGGLRSPHLSPQLFDEVSQLVAAGADIVEINANLFHHKSLIQLRLWGRVLARLKEDQARKLVWSLVPYDDFVKTGAGEAELPTVIEELIETQHEADHVLLLWQNSQRTISGVLKTEPQHNALRLLETLHPHGRSTYATFELKINDLLEAERHVLNLLQAQLS